MTDDALSFVLDGLEDYLALERELGAETVEVDRSLLSSVRPSPIQAAVSRPQPAAPRPAAPPPPPSSPRPDPSPAAVADFAFIHDGPLSEKSREMMGKIVAALKSDDAHSPIAVRLPLPKARLYVFLGRATLRKFLPQVSVEENDWFRTPKNVEALLVKSPEEIVRFATVTPALRRIKEEMWRALKTIHQHLPKESHV